MSIVFPPPNYRPTPLNTLLANALDLTAPASNILLRNRKNAWVQLAGHPGFFAPAGPLTIWKRQAGEKNCNESYAYRSFLEDPLRDFVPKFYREVTYNKEVFIEIEDLLQKFNDPNIMDIKMGTRTFLESEVDNPKLREDLYDKLVKIDPLEPTAEEQSQKAVTKLRYMQFRENQSSSAMLGFRIEAVKVAGKHPQTDWKKVKTTDQVAEAMCKFFNFNRNVCLSALKRMKDMKKHLEASKFFKTHELIGSSLLILYDADETVGVWMIDFTKTLPIPANFRKLSHRQPWQPGNHEDGYLFGLDNLIQILKDLCTELTVPASPHRNECSFVLK